jgi:DNA-directed RNA polymerase subunit RPC12/RpoP
MKYQCDNCSAILTTEELRTINRYWERVDEDGVEPDGECPHCGCLAYEVEEVTP